MDNEKPNLKKNYTKSRNVTDMMKNLGKIPPQAVDLEEAVLGALMMLQDAVTEVIDFLRPETFYHEKNQRIFAAIRELYDKSEPIDLLTVTHKLRQRGDLDFVGGPYYITELTTKINSAANLEAHARILSELSIKRDLISIATEIERDAYEDTSDVFDLLDKTEQAIFKVSEVNISKSYHEMHSILREALEELQKRRNQPDTLTGVPSGFRELDRVTSGWQKSDLIILAARPGMGKTAFVVSAMRNAAVDFKAPVAIFSLEMDRIQLVNRLISAEAELDSEKIKKGNLEEYEWQQLHHKIRSLENAPIYIDDTPGLSIRELRTKCRRLQKNFGIQMVIIDYLQLMSGEGNSKGPSGNREQEIAGISRALKNLAKELSVPVIALSQLSRAVETRGGDKKPQLADLRESGAIEQDADMVIFLYRPEYYKIEQDEQGNSLKGVGEVIIAKHRNGSLGSVLLRFIGKFTKFGDLDSHSFGGSTGFDDNMVVDQFDPFNNKTISSKINDFGKSGFDPDDSDGKVPF